MSLKEQWAARAEADAKKRWRPITVTLTPEDAREVRRLAKIYGSIAEVLRAAMGEPYRAAHRPVGGELLSFSATSAEEASLRAEARVLGLPLSALVRGKVHSVLRSAKPITRKPPPRVRTEGIKVE